MIPPSLILAVAIAGPQQAAVRCDSVCEALIEAGIRWVAETRGVPLGEVVVFVPRDGYPNHDSLLPAARRMEARMGLRVASGRSPVVCQPLEEAQSAGDLPRDWMKTRCRLTEGRVQVRLTQVPKASGGSALVSMQHSTFGADGYGRIHELHFRLVGGSWRLDRAEVIAG